MITKRLSVRATAFAVGAASLIGAIAPVVSVSAATQTCTWTGAGSDNKFSTAANWSNCGSAAPQAGDIIRFNQMQSTTKALVNDLSVDLGGVVTSAVVSGTNYNGYSVDKLSFTAGATVSVEPGSECNVRIATLEPTVVTGTGNLIVQKEAFGWNPYKLTTPGDLTIKSIYGGAISSFTAGSSAANVTIASPLGLAGYTSATSCASGGGASGGGTASNDLTGLSYGALTVQNGASFQFVNYDKPVTFGGGSGTASPTAYFSSDYDESGQAIVANRTWSSAVTLLSNTDVNVGEKVAVTFTGTLSGAGKTLQKTTYSSGTFTNNASSNTSATPSGAQVNPVKVTEITDKVDEYITVVPNETVVLDGERIGVSVMNGGTLKGNGTLKGGLYVYEGGVVAPGRSPGCLTVDTLSIDGEYQFDLGGTDPCTGYDQIKVTNKTATYATVRLNDKTSVLTTTRFKGYTPKQGQVFTIIDNQGTQAVQGTFKDLPEGATFTQNGVIFKISYKGGDNNDVTLTVMNQPTAPDTGFELIKANPILSLVAAVGGAGILAMIGRRSQSRR